MTASPPTLRLRVDAAPAARRVVAAALLAGEGDLAGLRFW